MPEITVLIYTARDDYPYLGKAEGWHCFEPFLRTLADQTFRDFELVLVDALWERRPDWFRDHPQPFPVKHVPASPNYWHARGRPGLSAQLNRGFVWADGKYVWMGGENTLYSPHHLALVSELCRAGKSPSAWYGIADREIPPNQASVEVFNGACPHVSFDLQGFARNDLYSMDHRAARFCSDESLVISPCHPHNYFGYSGLPLDVALNVNGFDELMDGCKALQDCDFGSRIARAGAQLVMHRNLFVVEPPTKPLTDADGYGGGIRLQQVFQCNYAVLLHNDQTGRRVNRALPDGYVEDVKAKICRGSCPIKSKCEGGTIGESKVYPFCEGELAAVAREWHKDAPDYELADEAEKRRRREPPYDRGYIQ